ncbi:polymerase [Caenimonas sedimenti]|uniref:Polymerase n=1 Tax=Caenimonas sedimenti TaxID=2596921 RepID=A0A562ZF80_9BURK|nr:Wzy polymerase domain-containing protein [Caenimonas sedimenti]TWO66645.1 polymerase [Caenimonas sedimenti]
MNEPSRPWPGPVRTLAAGALLVLPWLNPFAPGPSPAVEPWLVTFACVLVLRWRFAGAAVAFPWRAGLALFAAWAVLRSGVTLDTVALAGGLLLMVLAAGVAVEWARAGRVHWIAGAWLAAAFASTAVALLQYFGADALLAPWVSLSPAGEAYANLRQRNQFASLTVIGTAAAWWFLREGRGRWFAWAAIVLLAVGNAATTSRTGLLQLALLAALGVLWPGPARLKAVRAGVVALASYTAAALLLPLLLVQAGGPLRARLWERTAEIASCSSRSVLWSNVSELVAQRPWLGWGWGELDHAHFVNLYAGARFCDILDNAHSLPLHVAVELGLPALLLALVALGVAVWRAAPWREADPARQLAWAVLALIGIHSLLEYPLWYGPFQLAAGLCIGLLWPGRQPEAAPPARTWARGAVAAAAVVLLYALWDYRRVSQIYLPAEERLAPWRDDTADHVARSRLFSQQARFALLTIAQLSRDNAQWTLDTAEAVLHYSPEPKIAEKAIESATMLGEDDRAVLHLARYRAAFPQAYSDWASRNGLR